jgi:hypothetical protein
MVVEVVGMAPACAQSFVLKLPVLGLKFAFSSSSFALVMSLTTTRHTQPR